MPNNNYNNAQQPKYSKLELQVTNDLTVQVIANPHYEFLMDTKSVALGYGVPVQTINFHKFQQKSELKEGEHWTTVGAIGNSNRINISNENLPTNATLWTKAGVIRLGFFIKSERAIMFRDWAEQVILKATAPEVVLPQTKRRNHNRLTNQRLVEILADIALIDDKDLRIRLMSKLLPDNQVVQTTLFTSNQGGGHA